MSTYSTRFLLGRMPTRDVPGFLRMLEATGVKHHPADELSCMESSTPGRSTVMVWVVCPHPVQERWQKDPRVISLREGQPYT